MTTTLPPFNPDTTAYQSQLEEALFSITEHALDEWTKDSNKRIERALGENMKQIESLVTQAINDIQNGILQSETTSQAPQSPSISGDLSYASLGNSLGRLLVNVVSDQLNQSSVSTHTSETQRSTDLREQRSRSQQQAETIQNTEKGSRNL